MELQALVTQLVSAVREFIAPRYRPEFHYMRGPGPACAHRAQIPFPPIHDRANRHLGRSAIGGTQPRSYMV
jgi:hypothetical protein